MQHIGRAATEQLLDDLEHPLSLIDVDCPLMQQVRPTQGRLRPLPPPGPLPETARVRALARRKVVSMPIVGVSGGVAALGFDAGQPGFWGRLASALPLVALAAGLVAINVIQNDNRAEEVAEVDAALLIDDLPPSASADPGFMQFLNGAGDRAP